MSMYSIVRIVFAIFLSITLIYFVCKNMSPKKRQIIISFIIFCCFSLSALLHLVPFENVFMSFDTPEDAINYYSNHDVVHIINGKDSCLIISEGKSTNTAQILTKGTNGWKIKTAFNIKKTDMQTVGSNYLYIMSVNDSLDKYICVTNIIDKEIIISDNKGTEFFKDSEGHYYAYIHDFSPYYALSIDEKEVKFF